MKWQALALSVLASTGLASPINPEARDTAAQKVYTLRLSSKEPSLDGQYLGVNGTLVGVFKAASVVRFYTVPNAKTGNVELHTYPVGVVDHALALVGSESHGLLDFSDVVNPASTTFPTGTKCDYTSFRLSAGEQVAADNTLVYAGASNGRWVVFPTGNGAEWSVKWKASSALTIQNYQLVDVVYEPILRAPVSEST
ncbi:hypothetical protein B0T22DRAFT_533703 [Podospora appendiculata]|uniref:Uncharacterized protein n=1 Tax=Podospora appendiculata TaxID=314037 RepID=A0AAE0XJU5_9PEZI|nr:hypothetical protein B0T22DRAFT_533703 [Podospora appendiculata]